MRREKKLFWCALVYPMHKKFIFYCSLVYQDEIQRNLNEIQEYQTKAQEWQTKIQECQADIQRCLSEIQQIKNTRRLADDGLLKKESAEGKQEGPGTVIDLT